MKTIGLNYIVDKGWNPSEFPKIDEKNSLVIIFAAPELCSESPEILGQLIEAYPESQIMGCSTAGEIYSENVNDQSISVAILSFERSHIKVAVVPVIEFNSQETGKILGKILNDDHLKGVLVLSDGINVNGSALSAGINESLPKNTIVTGGLAGDGDRFQKTWTITKNGVKKDHIIAAGFYGEHLIFSHGSKGGWDIFGPERIVTKSIDNILYELDNRPALELYEEYLGNKAQELPASALLFPLQIRKNVSDQKRLVRTVLGIDKKKNSMTFAGDIPTGSLAQLMKANFDRLVEGASTAANITALQGLNHKLPLLMLAISCVGRRLVLGERIEEETEATLSSLPHKNVLQIGFYAYGELSPFTEKGPCELHNQTMTITVIGENDAP